MFTRKYKVGESQQQKAWAQIPAGLKIFNRGLKLKIKIGVLGFISPGIHFHDAWQAYGAAFFEPSTHEDMEIFGKKYVHIDETGWDEAITSNRDVKNFELSRSRSRIKYTITLVVGFEGWPKYWSHRIIIIVQKKYNFLFNYWTCLNFYIEIFIIFFL